MAAIQTQLLNSDNNARGEVGFGERAISNADDFKTLFQNISVDNAATISDRYGEITRALNIEFRGTDSRIANNLQVGSYGRLTAIRGISDLDMLYIMPTGSWNNFKDGGQYKLLRKTADAILARYPTTEVYPDTLVVVVQYGNFKIEVQPVFLDTNGDYIYPYTKNGGSWRTTKPRPELKAASDVDVEKNGNLRRLAKLARAWRNKHGVQMGGLLIDTLVHNFLNSTKDFDTTRFGGCGHMITDFLTYLSGQPNQDRYAALGSGQHVKVHKQFQRKARKGLEIAKKAFLAGDDPTANAIWRRLLGRGFPAAAEMIVEKAFLGDGQYQAKNTEQFVEDRFTVDIRYGLRIDCEVTQSGFRAFFVRADKALLNNRFIKRKKSLRFFIRENSIAGPFDIYWKVLNRGSEAIRLDQVRGKIERGTVSKKETSTFKGEHVVDCYAVQHGVVVAKDRIHVPIIEESEG